MYIVLHSSMLVLKQSSINNLVFHMILNPACPKWSTELWASSHREYFILMSTNYKWHVSMEGDSGGLRTTRNRMSIEDESWEAVHCSTKELFGEWGHGRVYMFSADAGVVIDPSWNVGGGKRRTKRIGCSTFTLKRRSSSLPASH